MTPKETRVLFQQYLKEIDDRPSEKTVITYLKSLDGQISKWAKQLGLVKESIYEKHSPKDVEFIGESLKKNVDLKKNNNFYYTPFNWYKRFCNTYFEDESIVHIATLNIAEENQPILEETEYIIEGGKKIVISVIAERNQSLRKKAIAIHGLVCRACGFDFKKKYGNAGEGFIEIHHIQQLRSEEEFILVNTNPETDLIPLCSNCHRIVHRSKKHILSIAELKEILSKHANDN